MKTLLLIICIFISACGNEPKERSSVMSLSISSDGRFVLTAHHGRMLWLWDLKNKTHKEISNDANIYSPYFIKGTEKFIWQDIKNDMVYIQDTKGHLIKTFYPGFASYGEVMSSDLKDYVGSNLGWQLTKVTNDKKTIIMPSFKDHLPHGKLLNLTLLNNYLLTSGACGYKGDSRPISDGLIASDIYPGITNIANYSFMNCVVLWDIEKGKAIYKLNENQSKTYATLSPDGRYVVAVDEGGSLFTWNANTGERIYSRGASFKHGIYINDDTRDKSQLINVPKDFCQDIPNYRCIYHEASFAVKFINPTQYLRFITYVPYAVLYDVESPWPNKYLHLDGENPDVYGYMESARVDTAPDKGILVLASTTTSGILVYQYNKNDKTLKLIWSPEGPLPHKPIKDLKIKI